MSFMNVLRNPVKAVESDKKKLVYKDSFLELFCASALIAITLMLISLILGSSFQVSLVRAFVVLIVMMLVVLFKSYLMFKAINIISGKGNFLSVFSAITKSLVVFSVFFIAFMLLSIIPVVGIYIGLFVLVIGLVITYSLAVKAIQAYTGADLLVILFTIFIMLMTMSFLMYIFAVFRFIALGSLGVIL